MLLTAIAFNLKKLLKHQPKKTLRLAIALLKPLPAQQLLHCWRKRYRHHNPLGNKRQQWVRSSATATMSFATCLAYLYLVLTGPPYWQAGT